MSSTIDDFRNFFKPNKVKEQFNPVKSIHDTLRLVDHMFESYAVKVVLDLEKEALLFGYPGKFSQVMLNLFSNAKDVFLEIEREEKRLIIPLEKEKTAAIIRVKDNAGGIPEEVLP